MTVSRTIAIFIALALAAPVTAQAHTLRLDAAWSKAYNKVNSGGRSGSVRGDCWRNSKHKASCWVRWTEGSYECKGIAKVRFRTLPYSTSISTSLVIRDCF